MKEIFDYDVYDRNGRKVGSVENLWADNSNEIGFIGIRTGWLNLGKNHVIPADHLSIDESTKSVRVPYDEDTIKGSPSYDSTGDFGDDTEDRIRSHFGLGHGGYESAGQTGAYANPGQATGVGAAKATTARESVDVPLAKESIHVEKHKKDLGEVRLRKVVRTETVNQPVELRHEDVIVERVKGAHGATPGKDAFSEDVVAIPVSEEEAVVNKSVESAGAVRAKKVVETERKDVGGKVRTEDVEVERNYSDRR